MILPIIETLSEKHRKDLSTFDCDHKDINEFARKDIFEYQQHNLGVSYILLNRERKLISFITLAMSALKLPKSIRMEKIEQGKIYDRYIPNQFPALKIGMLGTEKTEQRKGHAGGLIQHALNIAFDLTEITGCCYLILDAYPERVKWYEDNGFTLLKETPGEDRSVPMYLRLFQD